MSSTPRTLESHSVIGRDRTRVTRLSSRVRRLVIRQEAMTSHALGGDWPECTKASQYPAVIDQSMSPASTGGLEDNCSPARGDYIHP